MRSEGVRRRGAGGQARGAGQAGVVGRRQVVGRAELKLEEATKAFRYDFRGKVVLDIGSSTGGFTEFVLRQGAKKVVAVEKGTGQMKAPLRFDARVELYEKMDFLRIGSLSSRVTALKPAAAPSPHAKCALVRCSASPCTSSKLTSPRDINLSGIQVVVADVSFVSLRKILAHARGILPKGVDYLVMLKPQFEAFPDQLVNGVVKNEKMRREIMREFEGWLAKEEWRIVQKRDNETLGKVGKNRERFYWLEG